MQANLRVDNLKEQNLEELLRKIENTSPCPSRIETLFSSIEKTPQHFPKVRDAVLRSFEHACGKLSQSRDKSNGRTQANFSDALKQKKAVIEGIRNGETTHYIEIGNNGVTIPGSAEENTEKTRTSYAYVLLQDENDALGLDWSWT